MTPIMKPARLDQDAIAAALKGQKLRVPDLTVHFRTWPSPQLHPRCEAVVPVVDAAIDRMAAANESLLRRKKDDIAGLVCYFYPQAGDQEIEALALLMAWIVCWDDVVDAGEGDLANDFEAAERWRDGTLQIIRRALGVVDEAAPEEQQQEQQQRVDVINATFLQFGDCLRQKSPAQLRRRIYDGIEIYIKSCGVEQKLRLERRMPDYNSYVKLRVGTIGSYLFCTLVEFATQETLPDCMDADARLLAEHAGIAFGLLNDVLSLKKELRTDCVLNAVAALLTPEKSLDEAVGELNDNMRQAVADFDSAAADMLARVEGDEALVDLVRRYTDGCRTFVVGTLAYTLSSPRYNITKLLKEDGSLEVIL